MKRKKSLPKRQFTLTFSRFRTLLILFAVIVIGHFFLSNFEKTRVTRVIDGDTFETNDGRKIRFLGLDAPEKGNCMSLEAKNMLESLILEKNVSLKNISEDDYGRKLADVYTGSTFVNEVLIKQGLARLTWAKSPISDRLKKSSSQARNNQLGIYSSICRQFDPQNGCNIKGNIRNGNKIYHLPDCNNYDQVIIDKSFGDMWFCSENGAITEGFTLSSNCP